MPPLRACLLGELVESSEKPVGDRTLQAMAQAYPDPVDLHLLSVVLGCDAAALQPTTAKLVRSGLAETQVHASGDARLDTLRITDRGMVVAHGLASTAEEAAALIGRFEAAALRQLLSQRIGASRLPNALAQSASPKVTDSKK